MKYLLTAILSLLLSINLLGQFNSSIGRFEVDFIKGCAPLTININNLLPANCPCDVRFGDGGAGQNVFNYTYTTPGIYTLEIDYQSLIPRTDVITIEVVDNILPDFDILTCSNSEATVSITDNNYDQYAIDFENDGIYETTINQGNPVLPHTYPGPGSYTIGIKGINLISSDNCNTNTRNITALDVLPPPDITSITVIDEQTLEIGYTPQPDIVNRLEIATNNTTGFQLFSTLDNSQNTVTISNSNINTTDNYYCFRLGSYDACNNTSTYSPTVCSVKLDLAVLDGSMELDWNDGVAVDDHSVCTNGNCNLLTLTSDYIDINAVCNQDYCYQIISNYANGATSTSAEFCGTAFSTATPDRIDDLVIERNLGQINLIWTDPNNFTPDSYSILKKVNNEPLDLITGVVSSPYLDIIEDNNAKYCYQLSYDDICGNTASAPREICSIKLQGILQNDNSTELQWNTYNGYSQGIMHYRVEKYDEDGFLQASFITTTPNFTDGNDITVFQIARYKIFAVPNDASLAESYSNEVRIIKRSVISHPKAFTPNGDGLNDIYRIYGTYIKTFNMKIYNRWGELIFTTNEIDQGWDGTFNGDLLPSGSYSYATEIIDLANRRYSLSGFFALIRN